MTVKRVQILQRGIDAALDYVARTELQRRAENVLREAKALAPVADGSRSFHDGQPGNTGGGRLRDSLKIGVVESTRDKRIIRIFSDATNSRGQQYSNIVVRGSRAHAITGNPNLRFQSISRGVFVIIPQVRHPGTQPNDFLLRALQAFNR